MSRTAKDLIKILEKMDLHLGDLKAAIIFIIIQKRILL